MERSAELLQILCPLRRSHSRMSFVQLGFEHIRMHRRNTDERENRKKIPRMLATAFARVSGVEFNCSRVTVLDSFSNVKNRVVFRKQSQRKTINDCRVTEREQVNPLSYDFFDNLLKLISS